MMGAGVNALFALAGRQIAWGWWAAAGGVVAVGLGILLWGLWKGSAAVSEPRIHVESHGQSGGITAGVVNVDAAPEPRLEYRILEGNKAVGDAFETTAELIVDSPYAAPPLSVQVRAPSITGVELQPQANGGFMGLHSGVREGMAFAGLQNPPRKLHLVISHAQPEKDFNLEYSFG